jgi:hypothetical protein
MIEDSILYSMLDPQTAGQYKKFLKHQAVFEVLNQAGVFDIKNGSVTIDFSDTGHMMNVRITTQTYRRGQVPLDKQQ